MNMSIQVAPDHCSTERQTPAVLIDHHRQHSWIETIAQFPDASVYQTLEYARARWPEHQISTLLLSDGREFLAAALVRQVRFPLGCGGVAYVGWGPACAAQDGAINLDAFRLAVQALRQEYAVRRGLLVRLVPNLYVDADHPARAICVEEGFTWSARPDATILLDLRPPLTELRANLRRSWRQVLNKVEKAGLEVVSGTAPELYDEGLSVYREMHARKQFAEFVDKAQFRAMQHMLPASHKMQVLLVREQGQAIAALAWSVIGRTGLPLLAATGARALETNAAYLMWWKMIEWLKANGFSHCDLGGVDPELNPGGFTFKTGLAGSQNPSRKLLGEFTCCTRRTTALTVRLGLSVRNQLRHLRQSWNRRKRDTRNLKAS